MQFNQLLYKRQAYAKSALRTLAMIADLGEEPEHIALHLSRNPDSIGP